MLYNLKWLQPGKLFPPSSESVRLQRYSQNASLFAGEHFDNETGVNMYYECAKRIKRVVGNFEDVISFPVLFNYQMLMTLKMADLVCGEYPTITGSSDEENMEIKDLRDTSDFDTKMYQTVIDISRFGEAIQRIYIDEETGKKTFTVWTPMEWFPIVAQDGTYKITHHCICWKENKSQDEYVPDWYLYVQIHSTAKKDIGWYEKRTFKLDSNGSTIGPQLKSERVATGLETCAVKQLKSFAVTGRVYGFDDYMQIDSILAEIMTRVGQISVILDKHADPNITGPTSMLTVDPTNGSYKLQSGKFYAVSPGEEQPQYMVWDGQLLAAFKELELLINQLYILSEMGAALLGSQEGSSQAISGTAMRFKMVNPLAKARRIANALTLPVRQLFAAMSESLEVKNISVKWADGLPNDPRETVELVKLATGATAMMPLDDAIMEYFNKSADEASQWTKKLEEQKIRNMEAVPANKPGPQDGTGINPQKKGSDQGLNNFKGVNK